MGRIVAIDYGGKRTGLAQTDPLQLSVNPWQVVPTKDLFTFLDEYCQIEDVERIIIGFPRHHDGTPTALTESIKTFVSKFSKKHPELPIEYVDESYSSTQAKELIIDLGFKKQKRREKGLTDMYSAVVLLSNYLK